MSSSSSLRVPTCERSIVIFDLNATLANSAAPQAPSKFPSPVRLPRPLVVSSQHHSQVRVDLRWIANSSTMSQLCSRRTISLTDDIDNPSTSGLGGRSSSAGLRASIIRFESGAHGLEDRPGSYAFLSSPLSSTIPPVATSVTARGVLPA